MNPEHMKNIVEAALLAAGRPLSMDVLLGLFAPPAPPDGQPDAEDASVQSVPAATEGAPDRATLREALDVLAEEYVARGIELTEVSSGFRIQVRQAYSDALRPLWSERPSRYTRALLETIALIAYRQPITRGEIEDIRGVSVSSSIIKTLLEREWVRVVGHRDVPGKPAMYGTTRHFLDYFNLKSLAELPTLAEIRDIDEITADLFGDSPEAVGPRGEGADPEALAEGAAEGVRIDTEPSEEAAGLPQLGTEESAGQQPPEELGRAADESAAAASIAPPGS